MTNELNSIEPLLGTCVTSLANPKRGEIIIWSCYLSTKNEAKVTEFGDDTKAKEKRG
jgi:hypothetical protein